LTGSNRRNLDYILENVLDPSALVARDYRVSIVATTDGRVISGIVRPLTGGTLQIQTANETVLLAKEDIAAIEESPLSMMPEGAFERLSPQEIADLVAYLRQ
jgi:putative heme-binding domain-containing protein